MRKAALYGSSAVAILAAASAAQAQCVDPGLGGTNARFNPLVPVGSTVSGVQSLVSVLTTQNTAFLTQTSGFVGAPANPSPYLNGGGVWARGVGGTFDTSTPGSYSIGPNVFAGPQSGSCNVRTFQDYAGFQAGADVARLNIDGYNLHGGVTVGYTESSIRSNGPFRADFQTPFVGLYGAVTKGSFFADGQVRWDFYQGLLNDVTNTLTNQRLDARSTSFTANVGYQFSMEDGWFVEPSAGAVYSEVKVDRLQIGGPFFQLGNPNGFGAPNSVKVRDFDSLLGRASLRIGKNLLVDGYALQPFITASVINEFAGSVKTDIATNLDSFGSAFGFPGLFAPYDSQGTLRSGRIGTYGQFSAGVAGQIVNTGWLGYLRGDYRTGDRVEGWGLSAGLRYQFNPELAARPLITKGDAPALVPVLDGPVNWAGFSLGGSVGGLWDRSRQFVDLTSGFAIPHAAGVYAGGQVGYDLQYGNVVVGVAGDAGFTNARGGRGCTPGARGNFLNCQTNVEDLLMATVRLGYAWDRTLYYVKGGGAFANVRERAKDNFAGQTLFDGSFVPGSLADSSVAGWTVGAGFEYALTRNWSAKAEYMHYEMEKSKFTLSPTNVTIVQAQHSGDLVKVGVNYRFAADPVPVPVAAPVVRKY